MSPDTRRVRSTRATPLGRTVAAGDRPGVARGSRRGARAGAHAAPGAEANGLRGDAGKGSGYTAGPDRVAHGAGGAGDAVAGRPPAPARLAPPGRVQGGRPESVFPRAGRSAGSGARLLRGVSGAPGVPRLSPRVRGSLCRRRVGRDDRTESQGPEAWGGVEVQVPAQCSCTDWAQRWICSPAATILRSTYPS